MPFKESSNCSKRLFLPISIRRAQQEHAGWGTAIPAVLRAATEGEFCFALPAILPCTDQFVSRALLHPRSGGAGA